MFWIKHKCWSIEHHVYRLILIAMSFVWMIIIVEILLIFSPHEKKLQAFSPKLLKIYWPISLRFTELTSQWICDSNALRFVDSSWLDPGRRRGIQRDRENLFGCQWTHRRNCFARSRVERLNSCIHSCRIGRQSFGKETNFIQELPTSLNHSQNYHLDTNLEQLQITLSGTIGAGKDYELDIEFNGSMREKIVGLYSSTYKDENGNDR